MFGPTSVVARIKWRKLTVFEVLFSVRIIAPAGFWRPKKKVYKVVFLVFLCLIYVPERREMGKTALEMT